MSRPTQGPATPVSRTGLSPATARLSRRFRYQKSQATGLVRFRSPLLTESRLMSFPPATEMFQFAGFASRTYEFSCGYPLGWVAPFGDPGINDRSHLPRAFRSVPRPSSPLSAKASTRCPYFALERHTQRQGPSRYPKTRRSHRRAATACSRNHHTSAANSPLRRHFVAGHSRRPQTALSDIPRAARGLPLRSHNSLLYDCQSTMPRPPNRRRRKAIPVFSASRRQPARHRLAYAIA